MKLSKNNQLISRDWQKWGQTQLEFAIPMIVVLGGALLQNKEELGLGAGAVYILSGIYYLAKLWKQEKKYTKD